jgi:hypothetical protein
MPFAPELREKLLLWCDRRCCLCKKRCDVFIEVHHIVPEGSGGGDDEDNAIPLCFECHGRVSHYDRKQPIGTKFKPEELKKRRNQIYEEFTRHLVPALVYRVRQNGRQLPDVGFEISHAGDAPPIRVFVNLETFVNGFSMDSDRTDPLYRGEVRWNLNPKEGVLGHFQITDDACDPAADVRVGVRIEIYDMYDRGHMLLPVTYVYERGSNEWWLDPIDPAESAERGRKAVQRHEVR